MTAPAAGAAGAVYLDYAATTPPDPRVVEAMGHALTQAWANPASGHAPGRRAAALVDACRDQVAACLRCEAGEVVFTSGATEAVNTAILGSARFAADRGRHVVTTRIEHRAALDACAQLEREGFHVTRLEPDRQGLVDAAALEQALRDDTVLVTLTHVNGELGTVLDLAALATVCEARGVALHVDAAQSAGKLPLDLSALPIALLSLSAHKCYGPKGAGVLFARRRGRRALLSPLLHGGGQERGLRPGTLPVHQIVGLAEALELACAGMAAEQQRLAALRDRLWGSLQALAGVHLNGHPTRRVGGHLNVSFEGVEGESLLLALDDLAVSRGAACSARTAEPSYVLRALGRDDALAGSSLRLSLGRPTTVEEVDYAAGRILAEVARLRALAPGPATPVTGS